METLLQKRIWIVVTFCILLLGFGLFYYGRTRTRVRGITHDPKAERIEEPMVIVEDADTFETREIPMEEYVAGVVAGELKGKEWPVDAFAAQAILARTFAMELMNRKGGSISTDVEEAQAFNADAITSTIQEAVDKTRGEVIFSGDEYVRAWFHSNAGGHTSTAKVGLAFEKDEPPYIRPVVSPDDHAPDHERSWQVRFPSLQIREALMEDGATDVGEIKQIHMKEVDQSGRPLDLLFLFADGGDYKMRAANFRILIGADELLSTKLEAIEEDGDGFIFKGEGWGHGVGMSQWGAYAMAKGGKSPEDIIYSYFEDIQLLKLWD